MSGGVARRNNVSSGTRLQSILLAVFSSDDDKMTKLTRDPQLLDILQLLNLFAAYIRFRFNQTLNNHSLLHCYDY